MGPIDYNTQVQSPFAAAMQGYQSGAAIRNDQAQQTQLQAQRAQQVAMQQDLYNLSTKEGVTGQDYAGAMTKYPQLSEQLKKSWDVLNSSQQQAKLTQGTQAYAAIRAGRPDIAERTFRERSEAAKAAGDEKGGKEFESMADLIKLDPKNAATSVGLSLAAYLGPEKFASTYASLGGEQRASDKFPTDMRKDRAEAVTAEATAGIKSVEAANAPMRIGLENEDARSKIEDRSFQQEIAKLDVQIKQANSETQRGQLIAERDKLTLEREKLTTAQAEKKTAAGTAAQDQSDTINASLTSVQALAKHPAIDQMVGTVTGTLNSFITGSSRKDIEAMVETVKSQQFLTGIKQMQGMGALSNAEGDKIGAAVASLSLDQSAKSFKTALGVIETTLNKAQAKAVASGKLPETGGAFVQRDPRYGVIDEGRINRAMAAMPGASRADVIRFMQSQGQAGGR